MDLQNYIANASSRLQELEHAIANFDFAGSDQRGYQKLIREFGRLKRLNEAWGKLCKAREALHSNVEMLEVTDDAEFSSLIQADIAQLKANEVSLERELLTLILPPHPNAGKDVIMEIRPAAGGDEAGIFVGDLARMYQRYAEIKGWQLDILEEIPTPLGGLKSITFTIRGDEAWSTLQFESGVHRVQRVPVTETQGRIHTSTVTVAVMAEAEEVDIELKPDELRIDVFRASGNGGQCVNTTDSAVRVTHLPSGLFVASQQEKSQHRNKEIAMRLLRTKLLEIKQHEEEEKNAAERRSQVGTGDRSERIRTYNYPQNRITDHRFELTYYDLTAMMEGYIDGMLGEIRAIDASRRLAGELNLEF